MKIDELKEALKSIPTKPGVYLFYQAGSPIYIGKAASLRSRLASYIKTEDPRIQKMISSAAKVDFIETQSEIEALILESQLIKQKRPMFNIMLRDDKRYFYVEFSKDELPRLTLTHQPKGKNAIGPFTDGAALKGTLRLLRTLFPYCTCTQKHHNYCLNHHIGKCLGICCLKHPESKLSDIELEAAKQQYQKNIDSIKGILTGKKSAVIRDLRKQMDKLAHQGDLETAITLRTKLERLERIFENARVIKSSAVLKEHEPFLAAILKNDRPIVRVEGYDISNIQGKHATGSMVTFVNGEADKNFYRKFNIKTTREGDVAKLQEIIDRRLNHDEWPFPDLIVVDGGKAQVNTFRSVLQERDIRILVVGLVKNDKHVGTALIVPDRREPILLTKLTERDRNLLLAIDAEAHRFAIGHYRHKHRQTLRR